VIGGAAVAAVAGGKDVGKGTCLERLGIWKNCSGSPFLLMEDVQFTERRIAEYKGLGLTLCSFGILA